MKRLLLIIPFCAMAGSCSKDQKNYRYVECRRNAQTQAMSFDTITFTAGNDTLAFVEMYKMYIKSVKKRQDEPIKPIFYSLLDERDSMPFNDLENIELKMQLQERARKEMEK